VEGEEEENLLLLYLSLQSNPRPRVLLYSCIFQEKWAPLFLILSQRGHNKQSEIAEWKTFYM